MTLSPETCPCGWFSKDDCARRCNSPYGSPEAETAARENRAKADAERIALKSGAQQ